MTEPADNLDDSEDMTPTPPSRHYYRNGQDLHFSPITHEEERELFRQAKEGNTQAREFLITNHLLFAMTFARDNGKGAEDDELVSAANLALMTAIDRFDPERENRFTSFLKPFIKGEIARLWRSKNVVGSPRHTIPPSTIYLEDLLGHTGDGNEERGHGNDRICELLLDPDNSIVNFPFDELDQRSRLQAVWKAAKKVLTKYEMWVFRSCYEGGKSFADLARERKISREGIRTAHSRGMEKLLRELRVRRII